MKVFGIGLSRTGTSTLKEALRVLGYRHESISNEIYFEYDASHKDFETNDAFSDTPIMLMYQELDKQYEDSKFILTTRDLSSWLDSMKWMFDIGSDHFDWANTPYVYEILYEIYGTREFEQYSLKHAWYCHHCEVYEYFQDRPGDILVVDWTSGDGWEELCSFLDKPVPSQKFPHRNSSSLKTTIKTRMKNLLGNLII